jgi:quercetin dioxygenase-like cupin family protein
MMWRGATIWVVGLMLAGGTTVALAEATKAMHKMVAPDQIAWGKPPPGLPLSAEVAVLDGNPMQPGTYYIRMRLPDGTQIKPHWHSKDEHITVLSGQLGMGMGDTWTTAALHDLPAGGFFSLPAHQKHFAVSRGETIIQVSGPGPFDIHYVNPSDDPRNQRSSR